MTAAARVFLLILVFFLPYSKAVIEICVIGALVLWTFPLIRIPSCPSRRQTAFFPAPRLSGRNLIPRTPVDKAVLFFLTVCLLSVVFSVDPVKSLRGFVTKTLEWFVVFYLVTGLYSDRKHINRMVKVYAFTTLVTAMDAFLQFFWLGHDIFRNRAMLRDGVTAAFPHPNSLAGYCVIAVPFFFAVCFLPLRKSCHRFVLILLWSLVAGTLILTFSRAGWLAALAGILVFLSFRNRKVLTGLVLTVLVCSWCFVKFSPLEVRKRTRTRPEIVLDDIRWRTNVWKESFSLVKEKPWFGYGLNTYMDVIQRTPAGQDPIYAHNCFVQVLVETGLAGLAGFVWVLGVLAAAAFKTAWRFCPVPEERALVVVLLGALSGVTAFLVHSFFDVHFYSLQLSVYFWLIAGILMSIIRVLHSGANDPGRKNA